MSVAAKSLINLVIEPIVPGTPLSALRDQFYPYPPGRFAITHYEHRHDGWPDDSDGAYGEISSCLDGFIARFVAFDSVKSPCSSVWRFLSLDMFLFRRSANPD